MSTRNTARQLFDIEHARFGSKLGFWVDEAVVPSYDLVRSCIGEIDRLSRSTEAFQRRLSTQMVAVLWENAPEVYREDLRQFFIPVLSRMGIAPSTIMVDRLWERESQYQALSSYFSEMETTTAHIACELTILGKTYLLTEFQRNTIRAIRENRITGISAPTSSGKSFALYLTIAEHVAWERGKVLVIVPTLSLVSQVAHDLAQLARSLKIMDMTVRTAYEAGFGSRTVFVLTQERALSALQANDGPNDVTYLVVDEIQNIERVAHEDEQRSKVLLDVLKDIKDQKSVERIVLSGPRLSNIGNLGFEIFGEVSASEESTVSPVVNITYSVAQRSDSYWLNQYIDTMETPSAIRIENPAKIAGMSKARYDKEFLNYLNSIVCNLGEESRNIIFSPTGPQARKTALALSNRCGPLESKDSRLESLEQYIQDTVHPRYPLAEALQTGNAYHSGKVPMHARFAVESAFRMGLIKNIACTTTLMQGVNLPATTVIVRNSRLFIRRMKGHAPELSPYEFANLRGRAGRLLKDFIGRTIVLDESAFYEDQQEDLFFDNYKKLSPGYQDAFEEHESDVLSELRQGDTSEEGSQKFLVTYIRQTLLRMGEAGERRLREVGIALSREDITSTRSHLVNLGGPKELYTNHRFWDPFDLDALFGEAQQRGSPSLPNSVWSDGLASTFRDLVWLHLETVPFYVQRYLGTSENDKYIWAICLSAEKWAREVPLRQILEDRHFEEDVGEEIEKQIDLLMQKVVYGLASLLKPYAERFSPNTGVLSAIEMGVCQPITRELVYFGLSRDTATRVQRMLFPNVGSELVNRGEVWSVLDNWRHKLDFWTKHEIETVMGYV